MISFPNCKINIGLFITDRRPDGYHNLETVFIPLPLKDVLEFVPSRDGNFSIHTEGLSVQGANNDNLVAKAYRLLQGKYADRIRPLEVWLYKKIPMGAGLGGGSADAAFMLRMLNEYFELALSEEELASLALQLGSDCPFFIYNTPQFAKGRGEAMSPMALDLLGYKIRLICPHVHVSTAAAFGMIHPKPALFDLSRLQETPVTSWREVVVNDFEEPVFAMHPNLRDLKDQLYEQGAVYASMSGSGSALYGIYKSDATIYPLTSQVALDEYILDV